MAQGEAPALFVISDPAKLWAYIDVPESVANRVVAGQTLMLHSSSLPNRPIHARVAHVADFIDPSTRMLRARAEVDNGDRMLKAEMFVNGDLSLVTGSALTVPASAVFLSGDHYYAFVEEAPGRYVRRQVDAEEGGFGRMRVLSGLKSGERIVTDGALLLQHVMAVRR
jgi:cobalt-zinc-cadmium efflux system membrane fusion protein